MAEGPPRGRLRGGWGALAFAGAAALDAWGRPLHGGDEAWFVQVVQRVVSGEALYRDVAFITTPLSVYVAVPLAGWWGAEAWLVRALAVASLTATALLACGIARRLDAGRGGVTVLASSILLLGFPVPDSAHSPLAAVLLLATLAAAVAWDEGGDGVRTGRALALAGAAGGACFAAKPNLGLLALGALLLVVLSRGTDPERTRARPRAVAVAAVGFLLAAGLPLVPVWWSGSVSAFVDHVFLDKWTYLRHAGVSYLDGLRALASLLPRHALSFTFVYQARYLLLPLALIGLVWMGLGSAGRDRRRAAVLAAFCVAAGLGLVPRADPSHVAYAAPMCLVALAVVASRLGLGRPPAGRLLQAGVATVVLGLLLVRIARPVAALAWGSARLSDLPHFRGLIQPARRLDEIRSSSERLRQATGGQAFVLSSRASLLYLAGGVRNPTPFDYPIVTTFGRHGEAELIAAIRAGRIPVVCVDASLLAGPLRPRVLGDFVEREMAPVRDAGPCVLHELRPPGGHG